MSKALPMLAFCLILPQTVLANQYIVDVPQLIGTHGFSPYTVVEVSQQLPTAFAQISSGFLRLTGEHFPGVVSDFFSGAYGPVGATLQLEDPSPDFPFTPFPYFEHRLASDLHEFSLEIPIGVVYQLTPDFKQWLDGTAEFTFSVGPPPTIGGGYGPYPLVRIDQAQLVLNGIAVPEPIPAINAFAGIVASSVIARFRRRMPLAAAITHD